MWNFKGVEDSRYIYQKKLDKACFQHDMANEDFKNLSKRTAFDKLLSDKTFNIAKTPKHDEYQSKLVLMIYNFFYKKSTLVADKSASGSDVKREIVSNQELAEELHKPIIRKFEKQNVCSSF